MDSEFDHGRHEAAQGGMPSGPGEEEVVVKEEEEGGMGGRPRGLAPLNMPVKYWLDEALMEQLRWALGGNCNADCFHWAWLLPAHAACAHADLRRPMRSTVLRRPSASALPPRLHAPA